MEGGGVDKVEQRSYIKPTVHKHAALLQLSEENPIMPEWMMFMFRTWARGFGDLVFHHNLRSCDSDSLEKKNKNEALLFVLHH